MSDVCSRQMPDFSAKMHQIQFPPSPPIPWLQYGVGALGGNDQSLCFSLRLCFSNHVCSTPNSWRTRNQIHGWTTLTKNGPNLPLLFKLHEIWSVDSRENYQNCCHQTSETILARALPQTPLQELTALPQDP